MQFYHHQARQVCQSLLRYLQHCTHFIALQWPRLVFSLLQPLHKEHLILSQHPKRPESTLLPPAQLIQTGSNSNLQEHPSQLCEIAFPEKKIKKKREENGTLPLLCSIYLAAYYRNVTKKRIIDNRSITIYIYEVKMKYKENDFYRYRRAKRDFSKNASFFPFSSRCFNF